MLYDFDYSDSGPKLYEIFKVQSGQVVDYADTKEEAQIKAEDLDRRHVLLEIKRDMEEAHAGGFHELPREGCPECAR